MKISFKYGDSVITLPSKAISEHLSDATREEFAVLLALAADPSADVEDICEQIGIDHDEFMKALSFWRGSGAVSVSLSDGEKLPSNRKPKKKEPSEADAPVPKKNTESEKKPLSAGGIPVYTTAQIADTLEKDPSLRQYVENCQQIMGKMFSSGESSAIIGIVQYLGVSTDYVALLCAYAVSHGKKSVRYVEKMALSLYDEGICKYGELESHLKRMNRAEEMQPEIRKMFGLGERALTTKEKKCIEAWCGMDMSLDLIRKAYEITVTNTGKAAIPYCNSILESWNAAGYKTAEEIDAAAADYKKKKNSSGGSFDTDEFFEAALRRSYEIMGGDSDDT